MAWLRVARHVEYEADEGDDVEVCEFAGITTVILNEAAEVLGLGEGMLDHPSAAQQANATLGFRQSDDFQCNAVCAGRFGCLLARIAMFWPRKGFGFAGA